MAVKEGPQEKPKGAQDNETVEGSLFDIAHDPAYLTHPKFPLRNLPARAFSCG